MEVFTKCWSKVNLAQEQPKTWGYSYVKSPKWREEDGRVSSSAKKGDSNYTQHKVMHIWCFSQQVKPDSSTEVKWCPVSWSVWTQQKPVIRSHCLSQVSHCCYLPLKQMHNGHPHPQKDRLNTVTQVATTQVQAGAPALSGIPAQKHLRQQQHVDVESVADWHLLCKYCFFSARDNISEGGSSQTVPWGIWTVSKPVF